MEGINDITEQEFEYMKKKIAFAYIMCTNCSSYLGDGRTTIDVSEIVKDEIQKLTDEFKI